MCSRSSVTVLLVALVALSGCSVLSELSPNGTGTSTFSGDPAAVDFPNGTSRDGIDDSRQLVNIHVRAVAGSSYAVRATENISIRGRNIARERRVTSDLSADRLLLTTDITENENSGARYLDNRTLYSRTTVGDGVEYSINRTAVPFELFHTRQTLNQPLILLLEFGNFDGVGTVTRDGRTLIEYSLTDPSLNSRRLQNASIDSATGRVLVSQDGIIHFAHIDIQGRESGQPLVVEIEYEVTAHENVSVTPPDWLPEARNATVAGTQRENATG